jgi:hypothetical protein
MKVGDLFQVRDVTNYMMECEIVRIIEVTSTHINYTYVELNFQPSTQKKKVFEEETFPLTELNKALI